MVKSIKIFTGFWEGLLGSLFSSTHPSNRLGRVTVGAVAYPSMQQEKGRNTPWTGLSHQSITGHTHHSIYTLMPRANLDSPNSPKKATVDCCAQPNRQGPTSSVRDFERRIKGYFSQAFGTALASRTWRRGKAEGSLAPYWPSSTTVWPPACFSSGGQIQGRGSSPRPPPAPPG